MTTQSSRSSSLAEVFQANRVPIALIGVGVAWLLASNTGLTERVVRDERVQAAQRRIGEIGIGNSKPEIIAGHSGQILGPSGEPAIGAGDAGRTDGWVHQAAGAARGAVPSGATATPPLLR